LVRAATSADVGAIASLLGGARYPAQEDSIPIRVERWAVEAGCTRVAVVTAHHRSDAHAFYERLGYEHTGRRYGKSLARDRH
jgi:hypothetical protein